jgi:hypothetical protein
MTTNDNDPLHVVSYSEIDTYRQCPHKHELAYKERWQRDTTSPALARGTAWHLLMEEHYNARMNDRDGFAYIDAVLAETGEHADLLRWMYDGYVAHWGNDPQWEVLAVEQRIEVPIPGSDFTFKAMLDLVVRQDGRIWIVDHKSCKNLPNSKDLDVDDQFGLYTWAARQIGIDAFGSIHNAARTQQNKNQERHPQPLDERFTRTRLYRSDTELATIAREALATARAAYVWKIGEAPRSPNTDTCKWRCDYTEACLLGRKGLDERQLLTDTGFVQNYERH